MRERNCYLNIEKVTPVADKKSRARSIQKRMQSGSVLFDKEASWYDVFEMECLTFPRGVHDDQVDALAWLGLTLDKLVEAPTDEEAEQEEYEEELAEAGLNSSGRSDCTGY